MNDERASDSRKEPAELPSDSVDSCEHGGIGPEERIARARRCIVKAGVVLAPIILTMRARPARAAAKGTCYGASRFD